MRSIARTEPASGGRKPPESSSGPATGPPKTPATTTNASRPSRLRRGREPDAIRPGRCRHCSVSPREPVGDSSCAPASCAHRGGRPPSRTILVALAAGARRSSSATARTGGPRRRRSRRPRSTSCARGGGARRAPWIVPSVIGRRNDVWLDRPIAALPSGNDDDRRADRRQRLGDRREDAAVHEPERLAQLVAHGQLRAHELLGALEQLEAEQRVEADRPVGKAVEGHVPTGPYRGTLTQFTGSRSPRPRRGR